MKNILLITCRQKDHKFGQVDASSESHGMSPDQVQLSWARGLEANGCSVDSIFFGQPVVNRKPRSIFGRAYKYIKRRIEAFRQRKIFYSELLSQVSSNEYDTILLSGNLEVFTPKSLKRFKSKCPAYFMIFHGLSPVWTGQWIMPKYAPYVDLVVTNSKSNAEEFIRMGFRDVLPLPYSAFDPDLALVESNQRQVNDSQFEVGFVGSIDGPLYGERIKALRAVAAEFELAIWCGESEEFLERNGLAQCYQGSVSRSGCPAVYRQCKIVLNMHGKHMPDGGNLSTFEIPGSGSFQLIDNYWFEWFEEEAEMVSYSSLDDMLTKIRYYLDHEEERCALTQRAFSRVVAGHTYAARMAKLKDYIASQMRPLTLTDFK